LNLKEYWARKQEAAKLTDPNARYYGDGGTIHASGEVNVEVLNGEVVSVWFRCQMLPFSAHQVSEYRAAEMRDAFKNLSETTRISGVEIIDRRDSL
jgi:hypothetical protein